VRLDDFLTRLGRWGRHQEERTLKEAKDLLELAGDAMPEAFAVCHAFRDRSGKATGFRIVHANSAFRRMLGGCRDPVGCELHEVMPPGAFDWLAAARDVFDTRRPQAVDCKDLLGQSACEVRMARAGPDRLTLVITDRTEIWLEQRRHAERFVELNHRTKNNLANVAGLLRLQAGRTSDLSVREQLGKAANRVDAVSDAHASLYRFGSHEIVDLGAYLTDLCERLGKGLMEEGRVALQVDVVPILGPMDDVLPLGIIVNELVTNAAKYAYAGSMTGTIRVRLERTSEGMALTVADDGRGLPPDMNAKSGGLGMQLIRSLVRQLDGSLDMYRREPGAAFEIRLPRPVVQGAGSQERLL